MKKVEYTECFTTTFNTGSVRYPVPRKSWDQLTKDERSQQLGYRDANHHACSVEEMRASIRLQNHTFLTRLLNYIRILKVDITEPESRHIIDDAQAAYDEFYADTKAEPDTAFWVHFRKVRAFGKVVQQFSEKRAQAFVMPPIQKA